MKYHLMEFTVVMAVFAALALDVTFSQLIIVSVALLPLIAMFAVKWQLDVLVEEGYGELDDFGELEPCHFDTEPY